MHTCVHVCTGIPVHFLVVAIRKIKTSMLTTDSKAVKGYADPQNRSSICKSCIEGGQPEWVKNSYNLLIKENNPIKSGQRAKQMFHQGRDASGNG